MPDSLTLERVSLLCPTLQLRLRTRLCSYAAYIISALVSVSAFTQRDALARDFLKPLNVHIKAAADCALLHYSILIRSSFALAAHSCSREPSLQPQQSITSPAVLRSRGAFLPLLSRLPSLPFTERPLPRGGSPRSRACVPAPPPPVARKYRERRRVCVHVRVYVERR